MQLYRHLTCLNYCTMWTDEEKHQQLEIINISKILKRLVLSRLMSHVSASPNIDDRQSAYLQHHSPETSLLRKYEDLHMINDARSAALLVSLYSSAAFDCIEHNILLNWLHKDFWYWRHFVEWVIPHMQDADGLCWRRNRRRHNLHKRSAAG